MRLSAHDQLLLRREVASLLRELQRLPVFKQHLLALPRLPAELANWPWWSVLRVLHGSDPGILVRELRSGCAIGTSATSDPRCRQVAPDIIEVLAYPPRPTDKRTLRRVQRYVDAVECFARRYLLGAEWSARAVHDALRGDGVIRLPRGAVPDEITFYDEADSRVRFEERTSTLHEHAVERLSSEADRIPAVTEPLEALRRYRQKRYPPTRAPRPRRRTPGRRDALCAGALAHVEYKLGTRARPTTAEERRQRARHSVHATRARHLLNAAVNGYNEARTPLEPTDAEDYFRVRRPRYLAAARALDAADELQRPGHPRERPT